MLSSFDTLSRLSTYVITDDDDDDMNETSDDALKLTFLFSLPLLGRKSEED